jgi:hypothetical protein
MICGLSLISGRWMILTKDPTISKIPDSFPDCPGEKKIWLPPRSLYIQTGIWRFEYAHAISLPDVEQEKKLMSEKNDNSAEIINSDNNRGYRRISILFRNPLPGDIRYT